MTDRDRRIVASVIKTLTHDAKALAARIETAANVYPEVQDDLYQAADEVQRVADLIDKADPTHPH